MKGGGGGLVVNVLAVLSNSASLNPDEVKRFTVKCGGFKGYGHSSVDSSAPTILLHHVGVPSTQSMPLSFVEKNVCYICLVKRTILNKRVEALKTAKI